MRQSGFTPRLKDADGLLSLLEHAEPETERPVEKALLRLGPPLVEIAVKRLVGASPRLRARIYRLLGKAGPDVKAVAHALIEGVGDADERARRSAANALGRMRVEAEVIESALLAALGREETHARRAMVEALGKIGSSRALEHVRAVRAEDPELARIRGRAEVMLSRAGSRSLAVRIDPDRVLGEAALVVFRCREGLETIVEEEVLKKGGRALTVEPRARERGLVHAKLTGKMSAVFAVRTMSQFSFEIARRSLPIALDRVLVDAMVSERARRILETLTQGHVRYRISWGSHKRAAVWRCAREIAAIRPAWVNDPTDTTWEAAVIEALDHVSVELRPHALPDPRFAYRHRDVPAASHPALAAALVRVAGVDAADVVWDPFVGSGVELVERSLAGPYRSMRGTDNDPGALDAARENFAAAALERVELALGDATEQAPTGVTLILTNPPMGRRVARGTLGPLLERFMDNVARVLVPGGRMVWISPLPARTAQQAARLGLRLAFVRDVDMGGFFAQIQRIEKPR